MAMETPSQITLPKLIDHVFTLAKVLQGAQLESVIHFNTQETKQLLLEFSSNPLPSTIFVFQLEDSWNVSSSLEAVTDPRSTLVIIKDKGVLLEDVEIDQQLQVVHLPNIGSSFETLRSLISLGVGTYFDAITTDNKTDSIISTKKKINELALSLQHLQQSIQVPDLSVTLHPIINEAVSKGATLQNYTEFITDDVLNDPSFLNSVQTIVNGWVKSIQDITRIQRDVSDGSAFDEINFWTSMETSLLLIQEQVNSVSVQLTLEVLKYAKRYHATVSFLSDIGIKDAIALAADYNKLMKDLPLNDLLAAESFKKIEEAVVLIMNHLKRLRLTSYPVSRALPFVEAISSDLEQKIKPMLVDIMSLDFNEFLQKSTEIDALFDTWDKQTKEFTNVARELLRKRGEKFIFVRINSKTNLIKDRLQDVVEFRKNHEDFVSTLITTGVSGKDLEFAYDAIRYTDIFDGNKPWEQAQKTYDNRIQQIENDIIDELRGSLEAAKNSNELFQTFGNYKSLLDRPRIRGAIQEYQSQLLSIVKDEINHLQHIFAAKSNVKSLSNLHDYPEISYILLWGKQIEEKLLFLLNRLELVFGKDWNSYAEGQKIYAESMAFKAKLNLQSMFEEWLSNVSDYTASGEIFCLSKENKVQLKLNFDDVLMRFFKEVRALSLQGFQIPHSVMLNSRQVRKVYPHAVILRESSYLITQLMSSLESLGDFQILVLQEKNQLFETINKCLDVNWNDLAVAFDLKNIEVKVEEHEKLSHVLKLESLVSELSRKYHRILKYRDEISSIFERLQTIPFLSTNLANIIDELQKVVNRISIENFSSVDALVDRLNVSLKESLVRRFVNLEINDSYFNHEVIATEVLVVEPALEHSKTLLIKQAQDAISALFAQRELYIYSLDSRDADLIDFEDQLAKISDKYHDIVAVIESHYQESSAFVQRWVQFTVLWKIDTESALANLTIENWLELFDEMKQSKIFFDSPNSVVTFGNFIINFSQARDVTASKFSSFNRELYFRFADSLSDSIKSIHSEILKGKKLLESKDVALSSIHETVELISIVQKQKSFLTQTDSTIKLLKQGETLLYKRKFQFPDTFTFVDEIETNFNSLSEIVAKRSQSINDHFDVISKNIQTECQRVQNAIVEAQSNWKEVKPTGEEVTPTDAIMTLEGFEKNVVLIQERKDLLSEAISLLVLPGGITSSLEPLLAELRDLKSVWISMQSLWSTLDDLRNLAWLSLKPRALRKQLEELLTNTRAMPVRVRQHPPFQKFLKVVMGLSNSQKIILSLKEDYIKERHLKSLFKTLGKPYASNFSIGDIWDLNLLLNERVVSSVIAQANSERAIEESLQLIKDTWEDLRFEFFDFSGKQLVRNFPTLIETASNDLAALSSMKHSSVFRTFEKEISQWESNIDSLFQILDCWVDVQRQWIDLDGIFGSKTGIHKHLSLESSRFNSVSAEFLSILKKIYRENLALEIISIPDLGQVMKRLSDSLNRISKALGDYLEKQRELYPRFYFIGNDDLLEIIGNNDNVERISKHFKKMFSGITGVHFDKGTRTITSVYSQEGETVQLRNPVSLLKYERLDEWMTQLDYEVKVTLATSLKESLAAYNGDINHLLEIYPLQIVLLTIQITWTSATEESITTSDFTQQLTVLENLLRSIGAQNASQDKRLESIIVELVHQKDVLLLLDSNQVMAVSKFDWQSQQRFYFDDHHKDILNSVLVKQASKTFIYGFEYLGQLEKLVYTPLLNKCFIAMSGALDQGLGGSPFGPAGTGKTETVKALAQNVGKMVLVFNCDESFDFQAVGRLLSGICQVGAWGCFDEFNRLEKNILSAISSLLAQIETGLRKKESSVELLDMVIKLTEGTGIFVTMNPTYSGRAELPENLKKLFKSFSMSKPDSQIICEVLLRARGFHTAESLSLMIVDFFDTLNNSMSKQKHYDFGLRAIKSTLENANKIKSSGSFDEKSVILESITEMILPRLLEHDVKVFETIRSTIFSGVALLDTNSDFNDAITAVAEKRGLIASDRWILKAKQLAKIQETQQGIMLVGAAGSGKSELWTSVLETLQGSSIVLDAKLQDKNDLFGYFNSFREWIDGLFTSIIRRVIHDTRGEQKRNIWIVFDGDVDPFWIETLNSVLDDNKTLTLPNGERLKIPSNVRFIFEVDTLEHATPATISRCGMIWIESELITSKDIFHKKLADLKFAASNQPSELSPSAALFIDVITNLFKGDLLDQIIHFTLNNLHHVMLETDISLINNLFHHLKANLSKLAEHESDIATEEFIIRSIVLSLTWAFAGACNIEDREKISSFIIKLPEFESHSPDASTSNILDYTINNDGSWAQLSDMVEETPLEVHAIVDPSTVVETVDTLRHENLIYSLLSRSSSLILCGPPGSGKTMTLYAALSRIPDVDVANMNFSKETEPVTVLRVLEQFCEYKRTTDGYVLKPKAGGKRVVLFADEINLPTPDAFGTQRVISFLRQLIERNGFWRSSDKQWVSIQGIQIVGACNPPTDAGRSSLPARFLSHLPVIMVDYPSLSSLRQIYAALIKSVLKLTNTLSGYAHDITDAMIDVYTESIAKLTSTNQLHYIYSPRELSRWVKGIYSAIKSKLDANESVALTDIIRLWAHEAVRLFSDRLVSTEERDWTWSLITSTASKRFPNSDLSQILSTPLIYSDWLSLCYEPVEITVVTSFIKERLNVFSDEVLNVSLTLYDEAVDHILRIDRVLKQSQGHLILVGPSGSGKTTLTKFVAWMNGLKIHQLSVKRGYTVQKFDEVLKDLLKRSGINGEKICFIVDESTILDGSFLERMNSLLANSQIQEIFDHEEYNLLISSCKDQIYSSGLLLDTEEEIYSWFTKQVADNLHIVFTISDPNSPDSPQIISSPALFNRCVLNWMGDWSDDSLVQVISKILQPVPLNSSNFHPNEGFVSSNNHPVNSSRDAIIDAMLFIHRSFQGVCTPSKFLEFSNNFISIFESKEIELDEQQKHVTGGVIKLKESVLRVKHLNIELSKKQEELKQKDQEAKQMLNKILTEQNEAERKQEASIQIQAALKRQDVIIEAKQKEVMDDLELAEPAVLEARRGVKNIKKQHLTELRSMSSPPVTVRMTLESVCVLLGYPVENWRSVQQIIRKDDFIANIVNFDCESQLTPDLRDYMIENYLTRPDYNYDSADRASKACGPLLQWVQAQVRYSEILDKVGPLRESVEILESESTQTQNRLLAIDDMIKELEVSIEEYKDGYTEMIRETENVRIEMKQVKEKVDRSVKLLESLGSERNRWAQSIQSFEEQRNNIAGNVLLLSAFLTYAGSLDLRQRKLNLKSWMGYIESCGIKFDSHLSFSGYVNTPGNILAWESNGLANDELYFDNVTILEKTTKIPYIIDPFGQFPQVLAAKLSPKVLTVTSFLDDGFSRSLENVLRFGGTLLIEDAEYFDPLIAPLLNQDFQKIGGRTIVRIGSQDIDCSSDLKLFLHTKDQTVKVSPFVSTRTAIIDFSISDSSLEVQTLNLVLESERPDIEAQRRELIKLNGEYKVKLRDLEESLLKSLSESKGDLLENVQLLATLETLKVESSDVQKKMEESSDVMSKINDIAMEFQPLAKSVSLLFSIIQSLVELHPYYQFSLKLYIEWLAKVLQEHRAENSKDKVMALLEWFYKEVFANISLSLKLKDRKIFGLVLTLLLINERDGYSFADFGQGLLNTALSSFDEKGPVLKSAFSNLSILLDETTVDTLVNSLEHNRFKGIEETYKVDLSYFERVANLSLSQSFDDTDKAFNGFADFISTGSSAFSSKYDINHVIQESSNTPIIFCSSSTFDASFKVFQQAEVFGSKLSVVALGSKEAEAIAIREFARSSKSGGWLLIQNIQTAPNWLEHMEKLLNNTSMHQDFRLFFTCEINSNIPATILRSSNVVTFESEPGIKGILSEYSRTIINESTVILPVEKSHVYFLVCWYHGLLQERTRFIPGGLSKAYDFNDSDFETAVFFVDRLFETFGDERTNVPPEIIDWDAIKFLVAQIAYGGKVDDISDLDFLIKLADKLFSVESFEHNFNLVLSDLTVLNPPDGREAQDYQNWINELPELEPPSWIGLEDDAEVLLKKEEYRTILDVARSLFKRAIV